MVMLLHFIEEASGEVIVQNVFTKVWLTIDHHPAATPVNHSGKTWDI